MKKFFGLKDIGLVSFANIGGAGLSAIFWFYLAASITPEEYGQIAYYVAIATIGASISTIAVQHTITVYTAKKIPILKTLYLISLGLGACAAIIIIILFYRVDAGILVFGYIVSTMAIGELLGRKLYSSYTGYFLLQRTLLLILGLGLYHIFGVDGILYALTLSFAFYIFKIYKTLRKEKLDLSLLRSKKEFWGISWIIMGVNGIGMQIDKLIVVPLLGFALLGNYTISLQILGIMSLFPSIIFQYILPQDASKTSKKNFKGYMILVSVGVAVSGFIFLPIIVPVMFPEYTESDEVIRIMSLIVFPTTLLTFQVSKFLAQEKARIVLWGTMTKIISLTLLTILLGTNFGIVGVAFALLLTAIIEMTYYILKNKKNSGKLSWQDLYE